MRSGFHRFHGETGAVWESQDFRAKEFPIEERRVELEVLGLHIGKDDDVVFLQYFLVTARFHVVEIPGGNAGDLELAAGLDGFQEPVAVVDEVQSLRGMVEGSLGIDRAELNGPIADVIYFPGFRPMAVCAFSLKQVPEVGPDYGIRDAADKRHFRAFVAL